MCTNLAICSRAIHPGAPVLCSVWGKFHRLDIGVQRAIRSCKPSKEDFDMCTALSTLFGIGEGVNVWRGVAEFLDESPGQVANRVAVAMQRIAKFLLGREPVPLALRSAAPVDRGAVRIGSHVTSSGIIASSLVAFTQNSLGGTQSMAR